jgi:hypothetical protein
MTSFNNSFFVGPQCHTRKIARINDAGNVKILDKLSDAHRRRLVVPAICAEDESESQHYSAKRLIHSSQHYTHVRRTPATILSKMEVLSQSLSIAASILTIVAALFALAKEVVRRKDSIHQYVVKQLCCSNELTDCIQQRPCWKMIAPTRCE